MSVFSVAKSPEYPLKTAPEQQSDRPLQFGKRKATWSFHSGWIAMCIIMLKAVECVLTLIYLARHNSVLWGIKIIIMMRIIMSVMGSQYSQQITDYKVMV